MATIDTLPPINVSGTNATLQVEILDDGNPEGIESWEVNIGYKPHVSDTWIWLEDIMDAGEGVIQQNVTGLYPNTQYDVMSKISNATGLAYGDIETFWTDAQLTFPSVSTLPAQNITYQSSELELLLLDDGDSSIVTQADTRFTYWSSDDQMETTTWSSTTEGQKSSLTISGLEPDTNYWFYAEVMSSAGQATGNTLSFKTLPDPNLIPIAFDSNEPDTLLIQNFVKSLQTDPNNPHNNQGIVTYMEKAGNLATLDSNDVLYSNIPGTIKASKIVSLIPNKKSNGEIKGFYELYKDARPDFIDTNDPNDLILLELSIYSTSNPGFDTASENSLKFWLFDDTNSVALNNCFNGKPLTLQQISSDSNEPNLIYPLWDIRKIIEKNGRQLPLEQLNNQRPNISYAFFELSTNKELLDINEDNKIDMNDYSLLLENLGKAGIFRSDIASEKGFGLPDGIVDVNDEVTFINEYNKRYPENPIPNPYAGFNEDFESGSIQEPFTSSGDAPWNIDSNPCSGNYCVKSGDISGNQISILQANINTTLQKISFCFKVSCELDYDSLLFYIDDVAAGMWSGQMDWEKVGFEITPGTHNFKWVYTKDESLTQGQDCVWIDNIELTTY
ncbi:MAG: hypothetical protein JXA96_08355 [Sedimentisphaerales bacterium]|nr:hypothetical protein [Sedimentisphaerales bacterium]